MTRGQGLLGKKRFCMTRGGGGVGQKVILYDKGGWLVDKKCCFLTRSEFFFCIFERYYESSN